MARVTFLGLNMSSATQVATIAAVRGLYPDLIPDGASDNRAVQLVLKHIIVEHLKAWAARSALGSSVDSIADAARQAALDTQDAAATTAGTAANGDIAPTTLS